MSRTNPEPITANIVGCARCGGSGHDLLSFAPLTHAVTTDDGEPAFTHWALCPSNGDPILLRVTETD